MHDIHEFISPFGCLSSAIINISLSLSSQRRLMLPSTLPLGASLMPINHISNWMASKFTFRLLLELTWKREKALNNHFIFYILGKFKML